MMFGKGPKQVTGASPASRRHRIWIAIAVAVCVVPVLAGVFGRGMLAWCARQLGERQLRLCAVTPAQQWLARAAWLDPNDGRTDLLQAACFRQLREVDPFVEALQAAERKGVPASLVEQQRELGLVQAGRLDTRTQHQLGRLIAAGLPPQEVAAAFVYGFLVLSQPEEAQKVLDAWAADTPQSAHVSHMRGVYWQWLGDPEQAESELATALAREPRHELARVALAELLEDQDRLRDALGQYVELATRFPQSETALAGVARLLRKLGQLDEARAVLASSGIPPGDSGALSAEMAQLALEKADYPQAGRWSELAQLKRREDQIVLRAAATAAALQEDIVLAGLLLARVDDRYRRDRRASDLRARLRVDPSDRAAASELERLAGLTSGAISSARQDADRVSRSPESAAEPYARHCGGCHGAAGRGDGPGARHLFPRARDLRNDSSRLASALNGVASLQDVCDMLERGMPGTAMRSFRNLPPEQRTLLAEEVLRLRREGIREQVVSVLVAEGDEIDEAEVRRAVAFRTTPGPTVRVPRIGPIDPVAAARGKEAYAKLGCDKCHGSDGRGGSDLPLFDEKGILSLPRDLVQDPFKGGQEFESIYRRIVIGMPGTAHPSCANADENQIVDVAEHCRGLSREPKRAMTNHQRWLQGLSMVPRARPERR